MSYDEQKRRLAIKSIKGSYNVSIDNTLINKDNNDEHECFITCMCMLPNGEVLLADFGNKKLKKLNSSYKVTSHCEVLENPHAVCYIGNDTAVASLWRNTIQYVNVSGNINLTQQVKLDHEYSGIACHGDTLYVYSGDTIYKYDKNFKQQQILYHYRKNLHLFYRPSIAISDNGKRLYFSANTGLTTIDAKGNPLFNSEFDGFNIRDICIAGEGIVLVSDETNNLHQLDYNGKKHRTEDNIRFNILHSYSMCFDRERYRLIVGGKDDKIYVHNCKFLPS